MIMTPWIGCGQLYSLLTLPSLTRGKRVRSPEALYFEAVSGLSAILMVYTSLIIVYWPYFPPVVVHRVHIKPTYVPRFARTSVSARTLIKSRQGEESIRHERACDPFGRFFGKESAIGG